MSEPENFLARWSRRKQAAVQEPQQESQPQPEAPAAPAAEPAPPAGEMAAAAEPFDISTLPSLDSIGVGTDVRAFLQRGVPAELTRAALRRAWTSDPAIRDFIEVAENQWDFSQGSEIAGFGPLEDSEALRRMVAEMFEPIAKPEPGDGDGGAAMPQALEASEGQSATPLTAGVESQPDSARLPLVEGPAPSATQPQPASTDARIDALQQNQAADSQPQPTRRHGSALPG